MSCSRHDWNWPAQDLGLLSRTAHRPARLIPARPDVAVEVDQRLLTMLAAGMKDDAIARQLAVSSRTVGRRVADLMVLLGTRTRFEAGVQAERRRLLGPGTT